MTGPIPQTSASSLLVPRTPEQMFERAKALLDAEITPEGLLAAAARSIEHWGRLAEEAEARPGTLDGRASIYTGETYREAQARWEAYRGLLVEHLRGPDGGGS